MSALDPVNSRHRSDMATIFDVFCEIGSPDESGLPAILTKYPEDFNDEAVLRSARQFSFPCGATELDIEAVQLFSFVLTDADGKFTFGYCRYTPRNNTCLCILSGFAWDAGFYKILNHISLVMNNNSQADLDLLLTKIYHTDIPNIGDILNFDVGSLKLAVQVPDLAKLPTLREDKYMLEFFNAVTNRQMIALYASLLKERRIIFTSRKLSQLSSCIYAAATLIYPMAWQSVFIPVLPAQLIDMIMAPMPFLIGVPKQVLARTQLRDLGDVVIVDLEEKKFQSDHDDVSVLPAEVFGYLKKVLNNINDMGDYLSRCFLRATVLLFGGYRLGFTRNEHSGIVTWDKEKFVQEQRNSYQPFLGSLIGSDGVQYLERFIEERLKSLNAGFPKNDEFEKEITNIERNRPQEFNADPIQLAVQSVKENASDVIGALKDKVTGIQIGSKINKLTPKEIRKAKNWSTKTTTVKAGKPMSFDNIQWEDVPSSNSSPPSSPKPEVAVDVADLIDFSSPVKEEPETAREFDPFKRIVSAPLWTPAQEVNRSETATPSSLDGIQFGGSYQAPVFLPAVQLPPIPPRPNTAPRVLRSAPTPPVPPKHTVSSTNPFLDPFATPEATRSFTPPTWEKFD